MSHVSVYISIDGVFCVCIRLAQPPGQPEICKQSLSRCNAQGGSELFIVGKNFLKDSKVFVYQDDLEGHILWEARAETLKDYLQQVSYFLHTPFSHICSLLKCTKHENLFTDCSK